MRSVWFLGLLLGLSSFGVHASTSELRLRDYVMTEWTQRDGVPLTEITKILQTSDGRLWVATPASGLFRFDGIRFVADPLPCPRPMANPSLSPDGGFWGTCGDRIVRRTPSGEFVEMPHDVARDGYKLEFVDRQGRLWFFGESIRYLQGPALESREMPRPTAGAIDYMLDDSDGALWVAGRDELFRIDSSGQHRFALRRPGCLTHARDGGILVATLDRVWHFRGASMRAIATAPQGVSFTTGNRCMVDAGDGGIWVGTRQHGVARVQNGRIETLLDGNGRLVTEVTLDRDGQIWVGTTAGLQRFRKPMVQFARSTLLGTPGFVFVDADEGLWVSPFERRAIRTAPNGQQQVVDPVRDAFRAIAEDSNGRLWLSDRSNIGYLERGRFVAVRDAANAPIAGVFAFSVSGGHVWAVARGSGVYRIAPGPPELVVKSDRAYDRFLVSERFGTWITLIGGGIEQHIDGQVHRFRSQAGELMDDVRSIVEDGDSVWIGSFGGLRRWRGGKWTEWTSAHGLPDTGRNFGAAVDEIVKDDYGRFWLMTRGGILMMPREQLDATPDGVPRTLSFARIGVLDGVVPHPGNMTDWPRVARDRRGRLYFAAYDSVVIVDPSEHRGSLAPPITIESVSVDSHTVDDRTMRRFVEPSRLQFDYTSLDLRTPEHSRFRYRLEGLDTDWIEAGTQRQVTYGTLRPGPYRFHVIGAGTEGVWNETGASYAFEIVPSFLNTWSFRAFVAVVIGAAIVALHRLRMRRLATQLRIVFDARLNERTRIAGDLHDTLLQSTSAASLLVQHAQHRLSADGSPTAIAAAESTLGRANDILSHMAAEGRATVTALRDDPVLVDLAAALTEAAEAHRQDGDTDFHVLIEGTALPLRPRIVHEVRRIAGEAISNAYQHARATHIYATVAFTRTHFQCVIRDDGAGIDPAMIEHGREGHFGLTVMRDRAREIGGTLEIRRAATSTEVDLSIPAAAAYGDTAARRRVPGWWRARFG